MKETKLSGKDNKIKIVYIGRYNESEDISGPEKTAKRIFALASQKYETSFIQYFFDGRKHGLFSKLFGLEVNSLSGSIKIYTAGTIRVLLLLLKIKPAIIHIITFERFARVAFFYSNFRKVKIIYSSHGIIVHEDKVIKKEKGGYTRKNSKTEKLFLEKSNKIIYPSENALLLCQKYYEFDERKAVIVPNGIDEAFHKMSSGSIRNGIVVLIGTRLHESGRVFLKKYLSSLVGHIHLFIIGDKNYFAEFNSPGLFKFSRMTGKELADFYKNKEIFLSLNSYDTFSISTAEAMASGLVPIVTKQTGISSMIFNDVNGYVVEYDDVKGLTESIDKLRNMNPVQKGIIHSNSKSIYNKLSWDKVFEQYESIY